MLRKRVFIRMAIPLWMGMLVASEEGNRGVDAQLEKKLEAALHREIVLGDLGGAIELYRAIVTDARASRAVAAKSLVQMGECLEKLGRNEEAYPKFRRVLSEYPDQTVELNRARLRLAAWSSPRNLKFEEGIAGRVPPGWRVPALPEDSGRLAELKREGCRSHAGCAVVMPAANGPRPEGMLMQRFSAAAYRGKTVRLAAWLKLESVFVDGPNLRLPSPEDRAQLWLKVTRTNGRSGFADNMDNRPVRSTQWTRCEIAGEVGEDAESINFGVIAIGGGRVWIDDVSFDVVRKADVTER